MPVRRENGEYGLRVIELPPPIDQVGHARWLADTSALNRFHHPRIREEFGPALIAGAIATCQIVNLEVLRGTSKRKFDETQDSLAGMPTAGTKTTDFDAAQEALAILARTAEHQIKVPDLLIAAVAQRHQLTVLHYDKDYDKISAVTGQPTQWIAPAGTIYPSHFNRRS